MVGYQEWVDFQSGLDTRQKANVINNFNVTNSNPGNVYWVIHSSKAFYQDFYDTHQVQYSDGSWAVHPDAGTGDGIAAAIAACKGGRNDSVLVMPGSYQLTAALTMAGKSSVHLIAVNGGGCEVGTVGAVLLQQTGNFACVIMESYGELSGFQLINKAGYPAVTAATGIWRPNIHNNYFHMVQGTACNIIAGTGSGFSHGFICNNKFQTWVGGSITTAINIATTATGVTISNNHILNYSGTMDTGISVNDAKQCLISDNIISDCGGAGTITVGIYMAAATGNILVGNRMGLPTGSGISGGTADKSFVQNFDAENGGATAIET